MTKRPLIPPAFFIGCVLCLFGACSDGTEPAATPQPALDAGPSADADAPEPEADGPAEDVGEPDAPIDCPEGSVCGSGEAVVCGAPFEFAADPADVDCTPVAYCPAGAVCGGGVVLACRPGVNFAADPTHTECTQNAACPNALCNSEAGVVCAAQCVSRAFEITAETAPTREQPWVKDRDEPLVALGRQDAAKIAEVSGAPLLVPAHPGHASVPGTLANDTEFVATTLEIDGSSAGRRPSYWYSSPGEQVWRSTGTFAAPGRVFTVEVSEAAAASGLLSVQVGTHTDSELVWGFPFGSQPIRRFPEIVHRKAIEGPITAMTSAFGGLVYIRVAAGAELGPTEVKITNVARAPRFVHGVTTAEQWRQQLEGHPTPWVELETDKIVLTVRAADVEGIDPEPLMAFWDEAMEAVWELAGFDDPRERAERITADPAIEGIAHSGYPIHMAEQWSDALVDISDRSGNQWWTTFHELGHNFQFREMTFLGLQEATCNLWALHTLETVAGVPRRFTHPGEEMGDEARHARIRAYVEEGRDFENNWQRGFNAYQGFIPLEVYMQLQEAFGWDLFSDLARGYRAIPEAQLPFTSDEKIQAWIVRSSERAGVNLQSFYEDWGFPIDPQTEAAISDLPPWEDNPMDAFD